MADTYVNTTSGISLDDCFIPYEVINYTLTTALANGASTNITISLTNNYYGNTDYTVFYSVYNTGASPDPTSTNNSIVNTKTASSFKFFIYNLGVALSASQIQIMFWVVYTSNSTTNNATSITTTNPTTVFDDNNLGTNTFRDIFAQCHFTKLTINTTIFPNTYNDTNINISSKGWTNTDYYHVVSVETTVTSDANLRVCCRTNSIYIIGDTALGKTATAYNFYTNFDANGGINRSTVNNNTFFNILAVKAPTSLVHYNSNYYLKNTTLQNIFSICDTAYLSISGSNTSETITVSLTGNTNNYIAIPCFMYRATTTNTNDGTYTRYEALTIDRPILRTKTTTSFSSYFTKGDGDNWSGAVSHVIIFYY
jgi:hypothetical protein